MSYLPNNKGYIDETIDFIRQCLGGLRVQEQDAINKFIVGCKTDGNWNYIERFYCGALYYQINALRSLTYSVNSALISSAIYTKINLRSIGFDESGGDVDINYSPPVGFLTLKTDNGAGITTTICVCDPAIDQTALNIRIATLLNDLVHTEQTNYLFAIGQSNNAQTPLKSPDLLAANPLYSYPLTGVKVISASTTIAGDGVIQLYKASVNDIPGTNDANRFSQMVTLAFTAKHTYYKDVLVINASVPSTRIAAGAPVGTGWNLADTGNLTVKAVTFLTEAIGKYRSKNPKVVIFDVHGESDAGNTTWGNAWYANKVAQYAYIRSAIQSLTGEVDCKIIMSQLRNDYNGDPTALATIQAANIQLATDLPNVVLFDTSTYPYDPSFIHFSPTSAINMGIAKAALIP